MRLPWHPAIKLRTIRLRSLRPIWMTSSGEHNIIRNRDYQQNLEENMSNHFFCWWSFTLGARTFANTVLTKFEFSICVGSERLITSIFVTPTCCHHWDVCISGSERSKSPPKFRIVRLQTISDCKLTNQMNTTYITVLVTQIYRHSFQNLKILQLKLMISLSSGTGLKYSDISYVTFPLPFRSGTRVNLDAVLNLVVTDVWFLFAFSLDLAGNHDDLTLKRFPHCWSFVSGITGHWWLSSHKKGSNSETSFLLACEICWKNKQQQTVGSRYSETPWR